MRSLLFKKVNPIFILGAQKCGTSTLHDWLSSANSIHQGRQKEIHFFDNELNFAKGINWYNRQFPIYAKNILDSSPRYLYHPDVPKRVKNTFGSKSIKFIVLLRDPIERSISAWNFYKELFKNPNYLNKIRNREKYDPQVKLYSLFSQNKEFPSYEEAARIELELINSNSNILAPDILRRGFYDRQIMNWFKFYPRSSFFFLETKSLSHQNFKETLKMIFDFLEVKYPKSYFQNLIFVRKNSLEYGPPNFSEHMRSELQTLFFYQNKNLKNLSGLHLDWEIFN